MSKKITVFFIMAVVIGLAANGLAVTDDADILYVGPGEEYTLDGTHTYNQYVDIQGTLYVTKYIGSGTTGTLELIAPQITVSGTINGNERGWRTAEGPGAGSYPGGGGAYGGNGGASGWGNPGGTAYGTASGSDIQMGSGGASQTLGVGGPGGASVSLFANTLTISGLITVNGCQGTDISGWGDGGGGGAGGGILVKTTSGTISGTLSANGLRGGNSVQRRGGGGGGGGRIKIFYALSLNTGGATIAYSGGAGGSGPTGNGTAGGAGTYYTEQILVDNEDYLIIPFGQTYNLDGAHTYNKLVQIDGTLEVNAYNGSGTTGTLELIAPQITVSGTINGNKRGWRTAEGPGAGSYPGGGGAYGGNGGASGWGNPGGTAYGTASGSDIQMGSGGASQTLGVGGPGGASVSLFANTLTISGLITVNGCQGTDISGWGDGGGGGAGGGILIKTISGTISGTLSANGLRGGNSVQRRGGGGGAGGRIKLFSCCAIDTTGSVISYSSGAGGSGPTGNGTAGEQGTFYTEVDNPAPWRGTEATYQRWEFLTPDPMSPADELFNPYGTPQINILGHEWLPSLYGRDGVWSLSGTIRIRIPDRQNSGSESLKLVWLQIIWTSEAPTNPQAMPLITETSGPVAKPSAKYPDCTLETAGESNWILSTHTFVLSPNPEYEEITITGEILVDKVIVETICIPGLRTADLNGDGKVDFVDLAIFANNWLKGT